MLCAALATFAHAPCQPPVQSISHPSRALGVYDAITGMELVSSPGKSTDGRFTMPLEREAETYRREVVRLLAEGHAGRHVLIKGDEVVSIWDTQRDALQAGRDRFGLDDIAVVEID